MADLIRVVVVDDQPLVRRGFAALLALEPDIEVVAQADDGVSGLEAVRAHRPDVVLMDIRMPRMNGLEATREIASEESLGGSKVLILTTFELDEYVFEALRAGASGFLVKHAEPDELIRAVRVIAAGESLLSPSVTRRLITRFAGSAASSAPVVPLEAAAGRLTERERDVVELVALGLSNDEIAARWFVSQATVRTHVSRAMTKMGARDRAQMVVLAYQSGFAAPPR